MECLPIVQKSFSEPAPPGTESSVDTDQASPGSSTEPAERTEAQSAPEVAAAREVAGCGPLDTLDTWRG